jgi:hypothetical protein
MPRTMQQTPLLAHVLAGQCGSAPACMFGRAVVRTYACSLTGLLTIRKASLSSLHASPDCCSCIGALIPHTHIRTAWHTSVLPVLPWFETSVPGFVRPPFSPVSPFSTFMSCMRHIYASNINVLRRPRGKDFEYGNRSRILLLHGSNGLE